MTETLASYFPPPDASNYGEYEKNYPKFRKSLEERYPQVCHQCEPRVRAKIRDTGYAAKTDHLRRMMERSRDTERYRGGWSWKRLAISTGAAGWFVSQVGQLLWNSQGAFAASQDGLRLEEFEYSSLNCLWWVWSQPHDIAPCKEVYNFYAGIALGLGLCFCWWNPGLKARFQKDGRILGLQQYYSLQIIFLVIRTASWKILCRSQIYGFDARTIKAIHSLMLVFTVLVSTPYYATLEGSSCHSLSSFLFRLFILIRSQRSYFKRA